MRSRRGVLATAITIGVAACAVAAWRWRSEPLRDYQQWEDVGGWAIVGGWSDAGVDHDEAWSATTGQWREVSDAEIDLLSPLTIAHAISTTGGDLGWGLRRAGTQVWTGDTTGRSDPDASRPYFSRLDEEGRVGRPIPLGDRNYTISPDGRRIGWCADGYLWLVDVDSHETRRIGAVPTFAMIVDISPDNAWILVRDAPRASVWARLFRSMTTDLETDFAVIRVRDGQTVRAFSKPGSRDHVTGWWKVL